jgi:hypothetical protein
MTKEFDLSDTIDSAEIVGMTECRRNFRPVAHIGRPKGKIRLISVDDEVKIRFLTFGKQIDPITFLCRIEKFVSKRIEGVRVKRFPRIPDIDIGEELIFESKDFVSVSGLQSVQDAVHLPPYGHSESFGIGIERNLWMGLHSEYPVTPAIGPTDKPSGNFVGYDGNEIRFALGRKEVRFDVTGTSELKGYLPPLGP